MISAPAGVLPVFTIDRSLNVPLQRQVYIGFRDCILRGELTAGQQVPSSRSLAEELGISRFPILDAYAQLLAEGYFETRTGAGTYVAASIPEQRAPARLTPTEGTDHRGPSYRSRLFPPYESVPWRHGWGPFGVHQPAMDHFPLESWARLVSKHSRRPRANAIHHLDPLGLRAFREAICAYLRTARAVRCDPGQIMVVSGSQQALDITARVLFDPGDRIWLEEPCYPLVRSILLGSGCEPVPVPVDQDGLDVSSGMRQCPNARAAFVTPSHQYPLGVTMTASRRFLLLEWARQSGAWIIEDDYDSEYRYESMPISSLQGLDSTARVIYIGTFSKVLFPSLRLGYIVIPPDLVDTFAAVRFSMDIFPPYLHQEVLTEFIDSGQFTRHIRRMRALYKARRTALIESLRTQCGDLLEIHGAEAGMHLSATLPEGIIDVEVCTRAAKEKLWLWPLSTCWSSYPRHGFILGFGNIPEENIAAAVGHLRQLLLP